MTCRPPYFPSKGRFKTYPSVKKTRELAIALLINRPGHYFGYAPGKELFEVHPNQSEVAPGEPGLR
jgi:hypothetical protein